MKNCCAIILAAGKGSRMKSSRPKVLQEVLFRPMLGWVMKACQNIPACVITGYQSDLIENYVQSRAVTIRQPRQNGTGDAVACAIPFLKKYPQADAVILYGDTPFMDRNTIEAAYQLHKEQKNAVTVISAEIDDPHGYGRIVRENGEFRKIVEEKDTNQSQKEIHEINSGVYWFCVQDLLSVLHDLPKNPITGEYYITDAISLLLQRGNRAGIYQSPDPQIVLGANDQKSLTLLNQIAAQRVIEYHMAQGVSFPSTDGVLIAPEVEIGADSCILPGTILKGATKIGQNCVIGPNSLIENSVVANHSQINATQIYDSKIDAYVKIGPFCHIRPNSSIDHHVKIGDFVEVKNSTVGAGTAISHLTYIGDSDVGKNVNFGCGVVTVNYDGVHKARCTIDNGAFIGCNTNLIAPVHIGENAYTGAGSTITDDISAEDLGIARARQTNIKGFSKKKLKGRKKKVEE